MFEKIKNKFFPNKPYEIDTLTQQLDNLADISYLSICPQNTSSSWLGILNASNALFPNQNISLPQYYSNQVVSDNDLNLFFTHFKNLGGKKVILNGFPEYFEKIVELCYKLNIKCTVIYHGGLAELNQNQTGQNKLKNLFQLAKEGKIQQFGIIKKGLEVLFNQQTNVPCLNLSIPIQLPNDIKIQKFNDGKTHIGVFGNDSYNKNRHTQVAAASLIPNSVVHFIGTDEFDYLLPPERKIQHAHLNREDFLSLLGSMDINLYCSFTESFGQVILESLALGVPCIHNNNSGILDDFPELKTQMVIHEYDDIEKIKGCLINLTLNKNISLNITQSHNQKSLDKINSLINSI